MTDTDRNREHIVDILIKERAPRLSKSPLWPAARPALYALLNYREAREMADDIALLSGKAALGHASERLALRVAERNLYRVPASGRCIIAANHPSGVADGVAMYDVLAPRRPDVCFFANEDARRVCPGFDDVLIPVVWPPEERTIHSSKETLRMAVAAFEAERPVVIFPSGRVARRAKGRVRDTQWEDSPVTLARKHDVGIIPAHISGPFPLLFHMFDLISHELRDITLFHELLNKKNEKYEIIFGPLIEPERLPEEDGLADRLKTYVEDVLPESPDEPFV